MIFRSRLPIEFDPDSGDLVPIAVTRERHRAYLRECYPGLYQAEADERLARREGFAAGFLSGVATALVVVGLAALWLR
jgi:hypothetical protein